MQKVIVMRQIGERAKIAIKMTLFIVLNKIC